MGNSLRCCLACVLPCGALDLIRVVHLNGFVDELTTPVTAGDFLQAYPHHVLSKPCAHGVDAPTILILSPDSHLKKGGIYFLLPDPSLNKSKSKSKSANKTATKEVNVVVDLLLSQQTKEKKSKSSSSRRSRNRSRHQVSDWMPHLHSIQED